MDRLEKRNWIIFGGASILMTVAAIWFALGPGLRWAVDTAVEALPIEFESRIGMTLSDSSDLGVLSRDPAAAAVLARIAPMLADAGDPRTYRIHIAEDTTLNAFALPGGTLVINRGLLARMQDESELFGVLGHEAGHVRQRHFLKQVAHRAGIGLALALVVGDVGGFAGIVTDAGAGLVNLGYGRAAEEESDDEGLATLVRLRLDPEGMIRLLEVLQRADRGAGRTPEFISTHPSAARRIARMRTAIDALPAARPERILSDAEWAALQRPPTGAPAAR